MTEQRFNTWLEEHHEELEVIVLTWKLTKVNNRGGHLAGVALGLYPKRVDKDSLRYRVNCGKSAIEKFNAP